MNIWTKARLLQRRMNFGTLQTLLILIYWVHKSTSTKTDSTKLEEVTTRWANGDRKMSNTMSLPDYIQIDLKLDNGMRTLNLIKQSTGSIKLPIVLTQLEGQRSVWTHSEDQSFGIYKDPLLSASATVAINKVNGVREVLYMVTFTHGNKSFFLEPEDVFKDDPSLDKLEVEGHNKSVHNNSKILLKIDGRLHSLKHSIVEMPAAKSSQEEKLERELLMGVKKEMRIRKRTVPVPPKRLMTIEIFAIIDSSVFLEFLGRRPISESKDAVKNILYTFIHIMEEVKNSYEAIEVEGLKFTTQLVGIMVAQSFLDEPFTDNWKFKIDYETLDAYKVLEKVAEWLTKNKAMKKGQDELELPNFDCLVAFTKHNLEYLGRGINGIASIENICNQTGISLVKYQDFYSVAHTISHELGHNLGLPHDGELDGCKFSDFVMTPDPITWFNYLNTNRFSECSISHLKSITAELDRSNTNCFTDSIFSRSRERDIFLQLYPGQIYDIQEQCRMAYGPGYIYCGGAKSDQSMCQTISCDYGKCETKYLLKAMDGTSCSNKSWCLKGKCVSDIRAPRAPNQCVNGDSLHSLYENACKRSNVRCYHPDYCCATCAHNRTFSANKDCQDTSDECHSLKPRDCYNRYYATTCCITCKSLEKYPEEESCLYGDRGDGCLDLVPEVCHLRTNYCCRTCATYSNKSTNETRFFTTSSAFSATINPSTILTTKTSIDSGNGPSTTNTDFDSPITAQVSYISAYPSTIKDTTDSTSIATNKNDPTTVLLTNSENELGTDFASPTTIQVSSTPSRASTFNPTAVSSSATNIYDSCIQEDFNGTLEYISVWGMKVYLNCSQLAKYDSSLCHDNTVQKYCCKSCSSVKIINDYCIDGDSKKLLQYRSKNFTCTQLVKYNPRLCEDKSTKDKCCESCARFTIRRSNRNI